ncbi:MAG: P-loop NTPase fold protein, partial [Bacteroidota bacterium]|nr:P-loop NTPase fold protein [Bacteroidota bacterium]
LTDDATNPPLNIGILAPWGRGKTSLMLRLKTKFDVARHVLLSPQQLETKKMPTLKTLRLWLKSQEVGVKHSIPYATVWFNPWNYQSTDMIWAGLGDAVIKQAVTQIPGKIDQEIFWIQLRLARMDKDGLRKDLQLRAVLYGLQFFTWAIVIILAAIYFTIQKTAAVLGMLGFGSILGLISTVASKIQPYSKSISEVFDKYTKPPKYLDKVGTFHEVEADLERVLECIDEKKPLIVFVDDLDRCSPSKVVEVIEAINVFINGKYNNKCYFILGMDAEMVAAALDTSYEKMRGKLGSKELEQGSIGWYFLDKFIQLPFFIPIMSESKKIDYLKDLLKERKKLDQEENNQEMRIPDKKKVDDVFDKVIATGMIAESSKAIESASLTRQEMVALDKKILKHQVQSSDQNFEINRQVGEYSTFISSDPRSLKRFANLLRFYSSYQFLRMKKGEKFVEMNILAKWLAIMLNFPQLIRWIQWDSENKSGINSAGEEKAKIMDSLIESFTKYDGGNGNTYEEWLKYSVPKHFFQTTDAIKISDLEGMSWIKSKKLFDIIMRESVSGSFRTALECNVW